MTKRRLDFSRTYSSVHKKELGELIECYQQQCCAENQAVAVLVESPSGTGKTVLIDRFRGFLDENKKADDEKAFLCRGKFEERTAASEPFAAIIEAVNELLQQLETNERPWREHIKDGLGLEVSFLELIFPNLRCFLSEKNSSSSAADSDDDSVHSDESSPSHSDSFGNQQEHSEWRFERFRLAFRCFLRIVSTHVPLVFLLDDLHWADPDSLELLHTILDDGKPNRRFMFVAASRPIERFPALQAMLKDRDHTTETRCMELANLNANDIACLLMHLLEQQNEESVMGLADTIQKKTGGNPFVVIQMLRILEQKNHIRYDEEHSHQWVWDIDDIRLQSSISDSVTQVMAERLKSIDVRQRRALATAAIFGVSHFEVTTIVHAMKMLEEESLDVPVSVATKETAPTSKELGCHDSSGFSSSKGGSSFLDGNCDRDDALDPFEVSSSVRSMNNLLRDAALSGLVTETAPNRFKFAHDRVREAVTLLLPQDGSESKQILHLRIGRQLRSWTDQSCELGITSAFTEESLLLHATRQLNLGSSLMTDSWEKLDLAEQNFACAELAARKTSFFLAVEYLEQGLKHLGDKPWKNYFALTYKLSLAHTKMLYSCGRFRDSLESADQVLKHGKAFQHKRLAYHTKFLCLLQQEKVVEAKDLMLGVLQELGLSLPRRFQIFHALCGIRRVNRMINNMTDKSLVNLPYAKDEEVNDLASFLIRLAESALKGADPRYLPLVVVKLVQLLLEQGHCSVSSMSLMCWGMNRARFGNADEASRFGCLAMQLADQGNGPGHDMRARVIFWNSMYLWKYAMREGLAPLRKAFDEYWKHGALENVHQDIHSLYRLKFVSGEFLSDLAQEFEQGSELFLDYKQHVHWNLNAPLFQVVECLIGNTKDPVILMGKYVKYTLVEYEKMGNARILDQYCVFSMMLAVYFNKYDLAENHMAGLLPISRMVFGSLALSRLLFSGLVFLARFKETSKRKYKKMAMEPYRVLVRWANNGLVSCVHMHQLLYAEKLSSTSAASKVETVRREYDRAIESAASLGLRNHEALANELAGRYLKDHDSSEPHSSKASLYLSRAADLYRQWGAEAKVTDMKARYGDLVVLPAPPPNVS